MWSTIISYLSSTAISSTDLPSKASFPEAPGFSSKIRIRSLGVQGLALACVLLLGKAPAMRGGPGPQKRAPRKPSGTEPSGTATGKGKQDSVKTPWQKLLAELREKAARKRARLFPGFEKKYLSDLKLPYRQNQEYLDGLFDKLRTEDPDLVSFLFETLRKPGKQGSLENNTYRLIEQGNPLLFRLPLLRHLLSKNPGDRVRALEIFAKTRTPGVLPLLQETLKEAPPGLLRRLISIYAELGDPRLAPTLLPYLDHGDPRVRLLALRALVSIGSPSLFGKVFEKGLGLPDGSKEELLLEYLAKVAPEKPKPEHLRALTLLLEMELPRTALDKALDLAARLSPPDRKARLALDKALERWLSHPGAKVLAARAMASHGNKSGVKKVLSELGRFIRRNRRVPYGYIQRARAYLAFGRYSEALKDAKEALRYSRNKANSSLFLLAAEIEMRRGKPLGILRYLKEGDLSRETLQQFRRDHPELEAFLKSSSRLRRFFRGN